MTKRALITGITGQDGSHLAELLLDKDYEVLGMVRRTSTVNWERIGHLQDRITFVHGDLLDQVSIAVGGSVTGEHGIGIEKLDFMPKLFSPEDLAFMVRLRSAFNPLNRCSPNKLLPTAGACHEPSRLAKPGRRAAV